MMRILAMSFLCAACLPGLADVKLPRLISDGMVLQRGADLKIWGWASPGEAIKLEFAGKTYRMTADAGGNWRTTLPPMEAGGPYTMTIIGENEIVLRNILLGDVWFCSGQSNMVHMLNLHDVTYASVIAEANHAQIRQFLVPAAAKLSGPVSNFTSGLWESAVGEKIRSFSVVAYFFAKDIYEKQGIPIGIINASVGGTPIEAWTSEGVVDTGYVNAINRAAATPDKRASFVPKAGRWRSINIPGYWEDQGVRNLDGVVWYRREVDIPASMAGKPARVFLGRIVDADVLHINGAVIDSTTYMYPQRRYRVPAGVLNAGKNTFLVKVTNHGGKGGFVPDKPYFIIAGRDTIDLKGTWQYKVGEVFEPVSADNPVRRINIQHQPSALFNAMVAPATDYAIRGILWYQGESNTAQPNAYAHQLPALINDWRKHWRNESLPFLYVQLPGFMEYDYLPSESAWAELRESQRQALSVPNTAMAVAIDLGEWNDIHPGRKREVGERLALLARKLVYNEEIVASGPMYRSHRKEGNKIMISFSETGGGLVTNDGKALGEFAVAGADKKFVWAEAVICGDQVAVWNAAIPDPVYLRYAWADNPVNPNLANQEGLPASPFEIEIKN
ncbi:sialate O-acetylesterase [Parapedobacter deserti]|uniref:Sialate O-acetylesterase n=1 Tax=Parapedobacter deserti TaxID=1912957 RepID=A0ABV7JQL5_9SPHI